MMNTAMRAPMGNSVRTTPGARLGRPSPSMVAIAFLIPLAVIVRGRGAGPGRSRPPSWPVRADRAGAQHHHRPGHPGNAPIVRHPGGRGRSAHRLRHPPRPPPAATSASGTSVGGPQRVSAADLRVATTGARSFIASVPGGYYAVLQPVALGGGRLAVTEVYVPGRPGFPVAVDASWAADDGPSR